MHGRPCPFSGQLKVTQGEAVVQARVVRHGENDAQHSTDSAAFRDENVVAAADNAALHHNQLPPADTHKLRAAIGKSLRVVGSELQGNPETTEETIGTWANHFSTNLCIYGRMNIKLRLQIELAFSTIHVPVCLQYVLHVHVRTCSNCVYCRGGAYRRAMRSHCGSRLFRGGGISEGCCARD